MLLPVTKHPAILAEVLPFDRYSLTKYALTGKNSPPIVPPMESNVLSNKNRMKAGLLYSQALAESSHLEFHRRHYPDELHNALVSERWA